jgi:hypothetical protein
MSDPYFRPKASGGRLYSAKDYTPWRRGTPLGPLRG